MLPSTEIMILSGSVLPGVSDNIYRRLIEIAEDYDVKVILDADGEKLKLGIEASPYAIKPNIFEFEQLLRTKLNSHEEIITASKEGSDVCSLEEVLKNMSFVRLRNMQNLGFGFKL